MISDKLISTIHYGQILQFIQENNDFFSIWQLL